MRSSKWDEKGKDWEQECSWEHNACLSNNVNKWGKPVSKLYLHTLIATVLFYYKFGAWALKQALYLVPVG